MITQFAWDACMHMFGTNAYVFFYTYTKKIYIVILFFFLWFSFGLPDKMHIWQICIFAQYR